MSKEATKGNKMAKEWERQEGESAKAYAAFNIYLSLGDKRTIREVGRQLSKSEALLSRWSTKYKWPLRIIEHGKYLAEAERKAAEAIASISAAEWVERQQAQRAKEWELRNKLVELGEKAIQRWIKNESRCGSLEGIARVLELASKLGRLASGLATEHTEISGQINHAIDPEWDRALKTVYGEVIDVEPKRIEHGTTKD